MASEKQQEANRANAKRSTGPKTVAGKALSRMNAHKHGLTAETIVIGDEDPRAFDMLRAELEEEYNPRPGIESELVERLAVLMWRMRRIPIFEAALIEVRREADCFPQANGQHDSRSFQRRGEEGNTLREHRPRLPKQPTDAWNAVPIRSGAHERVQPDPAAAAFPARPAGSR